MRVLEFWPDHHAGPIWNDIGQQVELTSLGLSAPLVEALTSWNATFADDRLPLEGAGDPQWLDEGRDLLRQTRDELGPGVDLVVTEPWFEEVAPDPTRQKLTRETGTDPSPSSGR